MTSSQSASSSSDNLSKANLSYYHGVSVEPLIGRTLGDHFRLIAATNAGRPAIVDCKQQIRYTYDEFREQVDLLARGFIDLGVNRGDRVGIWSTNSVQWLTTFLAVSSIGGILVNLNPAYRVNELEYALRHSGTKVLLIIPQFKTSNYISMVESLLSHGAQESTLPDLERVIVIGDRDKTPDSFMTLSEVLDSAKRISPSVLEARMSELGFDDAVNIQYTSGTTGLPKGVTLSHHNLLNNGLAAAHAMELDNSARFCIPMPFYHCGGMISSALAAISVGAAIVIPGPFFDENDVLPALEQEKCTHASGVPTMFITQLEHPKFSQYDLSSLRGGFLAGAPCPVQLMRRVAGQFHMKDVVILYGLTEASPLMTCTKVADSLEVRATTVGRAIPGIEVKVIDPLTGAVVPLGVQGEICSRGHGVMLGYWRNEAATNDAVDAAGWLHSGDLGVMKEDGLVNITGRKKDMIIRGGENVYPKEVEDALLDHPSISQAQVFGIPDRTNGEEVVAWIMLKQGTTTSGEEIGSWLKDRISYFKIPKHIKIVTEFPMTVTGKIQKFVMRKLMIEELGLEDANAIQTA